MKRFKDCKAALLMLGWRASTDPSEFKDRPFFEHPTCSDDTKYCRLNAISPKGGTPGGRSHDVFLTMDSTGEAHNYYSYDEFYQLLVSDQI